MARTKAKEEASEKAVWEIVGTCKECGKCCEDMHVILHQGDDLDDDGPEVRNGPHLVKLLRKRNFTVESLEITYVDGDTRLRKPKLTALVSCKNLGSNRRCKKYAKRPRFCRDFPNDPSAEIITGCGFRWRKRTVAAKGKK